MLQPVIYTSGYNVEPQCMRIMGVGLVASVVRWKSENTGIMPAK